MRCGCTKARSLKSEAWSFHHSSCQHSGFFAVFKTKKVSDRWNFPLKLLFSLQFRFGFDPGIEKLTEKTTNCSQLHYSWCSDQTFFPISSSAFPKILITFSSSGSLHSIAKNSTRPMGLLIDGVALSRLTISTPRLASVLCVSVLGDFIFCASSRTVSRRLRARAEIAFRIFHA